MNWSDVQDAIDRYREDKSFLKPLAWALHRYRAQDGGHVTAKELIALTGASKSAAYRAVQDANPSAFPHVGKHQRSHISGTEIPAKRENDSRKAGIPPDPPIEEREIQGRREDPPTPQGGGGVASPEKYPASTQAEQDEAKALVNRINFNFEFWCVGACRVYPASWVSALALRYLAGFKGNVRDQTRYLNSILQRWVRDGPDGWASTEGPQRAASGARAAPDDPDAHLPPWVREKRRKLAENKAKFDAYLARNPPEPKGEAS